VQHCADFVDQTGNVALFNLCKTQRARGAVGHMGIIMKQLGWFDVLLYS